MGESGKTLIFIVAQCSFIAKDKLRAMSEVLGAMLVLILLGSDKTTTSVATGDNEFYPLYVSIGNMHNSVR
jgi:hypothetical protein